MAIGVFLIALAFLCTHAQDLSFQSCSTIIRTDCYFYSDSPECGSNSVTYRNRCDFAKAHCEDKSLHVLYYRKCDPVDFTTPVPSTVAPILTGNEAVLDFFCLALARKSCETEENYVCGSDGVTYFNPCEFEKTRCAYRDLHLRHPGNCTSDPFNP